MGERPRTLCKLGVLASRRELAAQIGEQFEALGHGSSLRLAVVLGGLDQREQALTLRRRPHVVVATPGRLAETLRGASDLRDAFARLAVLVLDEADHLLEASFEAALATILAVSDADASLS